MAKSTAVKAKPTTDLFGVKPEPTPAAAEPKTTTKTKEKAEPVAKPATSKGEVAVLKNNPTNTLALLTQAMSRKDAHNLQIVAALHKDMVAEQSRLDYIEAKRQMKRQLPIINKDGKIEYRDKGDGKGKPKPLAFASYENLHDSCSNALFEHGFDITHVAQPGVPGMINVVTTLVHTNGHFEQSVLPMPHDASGGKSGAQGWASAFSFGKRINMIGLLDIVTRAPNDRDVDGAKIKRTKAGEPRTIDGDVVVESEDGHVGVATVEICSDEQVMRLREAIESCGCGDDLFCRHWGIKKVSQLPAADYADAIAGCRTYATKHGQK